MRQTNLCVEFMRQTGLVLSRGISEKYHFRLTHKPPKDSKPAPIAEGATRPPLQGG
jgi:hypothetical protein